MDDGHGALFITFGVNETAHIPLSFIVRSLSHAPEYSGN